MLDSCCSQCVPMKISLCSHQICNKFAICSLCVPQHVPNASHFMPCPLPKDDFTRYDICFENVQSLIFKICDELNSVDVLSGTNIPP